ncbi:MAG: DNA gyrase subunit B [Gemmataceae bacterium]
MSEEQVLGQEEAGTTGAAPAAANGEDYGEENVLVLRDAAHIRHAPGMYIGDTGPNGLHHLVYEIVYNSVDEALAGFCKSIHVNIDVDGSISVSDDGRGIPVDEHRELKVPTLEVVMTTLGAGAKFDKRTYKTSAGLHGMGAKAVTALSEWTEATVWRNGHTYVQEYAQGKATTPVKEIGAAKRTGTKVHFMPDPSIFHGAVFEFDRLEGRLREIAFLNKGLNIELSDSRTGKKDSFHYENGIAEYVAYINRADDALHPPIYIEKMVEHVKEDESVEHVKVEVALQYTNGEDERVRCYANNAFNPGGGTHLVGFRTAITRSLKTYGTKEDLFKNIEPTGDDYREGLTAIVSLSLPKPQFESQTKVRLNNPEVESIVASVVGEGLGQYLEEHPKEAQKVMKKVALAAEAREAAAKAKKALRDRKSILNSGGLPGKLFDCSSRDRDECELFLVEGDSAGGSAEQGRDRNFQAVLPLRGKPLNVEKARFEKVLGNEEIRSIISAVGIDVGNEEEIDKLRYGKVIILTDADVDGQHIRTLLLTFFFRQMRKLVADGHIFIARPPLFRVSQKKESRYVQSIDEMNRELVERGLKGTKLTVLAQEPDDTPGERFPFLRKRAQEVFEGERLHQLMQALAELDEKGLTILERRGLSLAGYLQEASKGNLRTHRVLLAGKEHWFRSAAEVDEFRTRELERLGHELVVDEDQPAQNGSNGQDESLFVQELHEAKSIKRGLDKLQEFKLDAHDLIPLQRIAGREPPARYVLERDDQKKSLLHLRSLVPEVRSMGEKGISIIRFKGLGEMEYTELWDTTLNPEKRALLKVNLDDAIKADEMFRTLMGEKVEPRRDFIQKHALEVKDIDYHGA